MRALVADLRPTGELRDDLTDDQIADIIWTMNSAEYWDLLVRERSWTPEEFETHLADAWTRLLLTPPGTGPVPTHPRTPSQPRPGIYPQAVGTSKRPSGLDP